MTSLLNQGSSSSSPPRAPTTTSVQRSSADNNTDVTSHHRRHHHQDVNHSGSPVSSSTTIMQTPQDLFEKVQSEVKQKLDVVQHVHEVAYGMLLRELQRAILERGVSDKEAQENFLNARRAEDALRRAELRNAELEAANNDLRASIEAKEQEVLGWRQRADAVEKDLEWTKKELARVVSEADHNRQLLAMEVRNRAVMLKSMHENVGGGGSSSGNAITSSSSSPAVAVVAPGVNTNEEEGTRNTESSVSLSTKLSRPPVVASTESYEAAAEAASATISEIAADVRRTLLSNSNSVVQPYRTFGGTQGPLVSPPPPQGGQHRPRSSPQRNAFSSSSLITPWRGLAQSVNDSLQSPSSEQAILAPSLATTINNNTTTRLSLVFTPSSSTMTLSPPPPPPPRSQWNDVAPPWDPPRQRVVVAEGTAPPPWLS